MYHPPHVFSIAPGGSFLPDLVDAILGDRVLKNWKASEQTLADLTIYLPTRRAARALGTLFAERSSGQALLLPRIVPLGETDEAEFDLTLNFSQAEAEQLLAPPISPLERRLIFTRLIQSWAHHVDRSLLGKGSDDIPLRIADTPSDALALAKDLEKLMDGFTVEDIPWEAIKGAVEADYSEYFLLTLEFVRIAHSLWPDILYERQASDPVQRRNALLVAEAQRLTQKRPTSPILAAGSTGSLPATAQLLNAISRLPNGAVILPGLDFDLDDSSFDLLGQTLKDADSVHGHPQALLHRLITRFIGIKRSDVRVLVSQSPHLRQVNWFISECLRPAETTDQWAAYKPNVRETRAQEATAHIGLIEAHDEREEALAVSIALRETLETPGHTALLITPDRGLAERVRIDLQRWGVEAEDSAGLCLADSQAGVLARLICEASVNHFEARTLLALLQHPLLSCGMSKEALTRAIRAIELGALRGLKAPDGFDSLIKALQKKKQNISKYDPLPVRRLTDEDWTLGIDLLTYLKDAFSSFLLAKDNTTINLISLAIPHREVFEKLILGIENNPSLSVKDVYQDPHNEQAQEALLALLDDLCIVNNSVIMGQPTDYPALFFQLAQQRTLFLSRPAIHRRIKIMGLLEARLLGADCVILGGLDEGIWPPKTETDAFLNRPMRAAVGLSPPERRIGQTAHDFSQAIANKRVLITRAIKREGIPTIPSRFLQRIRAFGGETNWDDMLSRGERYRQWAARLDELPPQAPIQRPAPQSRKETFPLTLNVTEIETLIRDPYAIFARHILKLDPLPALAELPNAADRGTLIHEVLNQFTKTYPHDFPQNAPSIFAKMGEEQLQVVLQTYPHIYTEWRERFRRILVPYLTWEQARRTATLKIYTEMFATWPFSLSGGRVFTLKGRADRIELKDDGSLALIDFKTGQPPGVKEVLRGFSPQLTLEAMMLMEAAFKDCPKAKVVPELLYVQLSGGKIPFKLRPIVTRQNEDETLSAVITRHKKMVTQMISAFARGEAHYVSRPYAKYASRFSPYDHLARVKEWSLAEEDEGS